jgi:hypothetical protein
VIAWLLACDGPEKPFAGPGPLAQSDERQQVGWPDVAIAPDGTVWVSWAAVRLEDETGDVWLARSRDGGETFETPIRVDTLDRLFLGSVRQPVLVADDERVAVAVGGGSYLDSSVWLYVGSAREPRDFEAHELDAARVQGADAGTDIVLVDQPDVGFDAAGQLMVIWKQGSRDEAFRLVMGREQDGFARHEVERSGRSSQPCECCPTALQVYGDGEMLLAFRDNARNVRDIFVSRADPTHPFEPLAQVSSSGWQVGSCPFDGPTLADDGAGTLLAVWVSGHDEDNYAYLSTSPDRGQRWTPERRLRPGRQDSETWPDAASDGEGGLHVALEAIGLGTWLMSSRDGGATFTEREVESPDGPLFMAEIAWGPGGLGLDGLGLVGVTEAGALWYVRP